MIDLSERSNPVARLHRKRHKTDNYGCDVTGAEQNAVLIESPPDEEAPASSFEPTTRAPPVVTGSRVGASPSTHPQAARRLGVITR